VEKLFVDFVGQPVRKGEPLFTFYSPELVAAQEEYLLAHSPHEPGGNGTLTAADSIVIKAVWNKLESWNVRAEDIEKLERTREIQHDLTIVSPANGVVTAKNIVAGSSVSPGEAAYEITDLNAVWVTADAYQSDAARVKVGMGATVAIESLPDLNLKGTVAFVDPVLDPASRTFKVRVNVENRDGRLKPEMFAEVTFHGAAHEAMLIPADAVIPTGRGSMVFVALGEGRFTPRAVTLGEKSGGTVEVRAGLSDGEAVVNRANFLVDSESSLRAALSAVGGQ
jgi:membrane fusion protein, copper/silver efflux system